MIQASRIDFTDQDNSFEVPDVISGIAGMRGVTERGPIDDPSIVLTSQEDYRKYFGNELPNSDFPFLCLRHLGQGGKLRVSRVAHYGTITDPATLTALAPGAKDIKDVTTTALTLFTVTPKYRGVKYNDLKFEITAPSNGQANYFNVRIYIAGDVTNTLETYDNLTIPGTPAVVDSKFFQRIILESALVNITYKDLSAATAPLKPAVAVTAFTGGTNGGAPVAADYIGSIEGDNGFHSFDPYEDMFMIGVPELADADIHNGGALYVDGRRDMAYFAHLDHNLKTTAGLIAARDLITVDTKYLAIFSGGLKIKDPTTLDNREISELSDVMFVANRVADKDAPWISFSNRKRGFVADALGVVTNFGSAGQYPKLNALAKRQINMMVAKNGRTYVQGNFTGQFEESKASYINIMMLLIYIKKTLRPLLEDYLDDPTDLVLFRAIWRDVEPILEDIKTRRGLYNYRWDGDQDVARIEDVKVNTLANINQGIYKVKLGLEPINGLSLGDIEISLNRAGELNIDITQSLL